MLPDGTLTHELEWVLDSNFTNPDYPYNGTDMGMPFAKLHAYWHRRVFNW